MNVSFDAEDASRFLSRLAPPEGQFLEVRVIVPDRAHPAQHFCSSTADALRVIEMHSGRANVYVGACPRFRHGGKKDDVSTVVAFWADIDFHQIHQDRDEARAIALERLQSITQPPSMIVLTGNGVQARWILDRPIHVSEEWPIARLEAVNLGLAERLGGDHVQDLARVLRTPGTWNLPDTRKRARGCVPVMARLLSSDGPTTSLEVLAAMAAQPALRSSAPAAVHPGPASLPPGQIAALMSAFRVLLERLGPDHRLTRTWFGRRIPNDDSKSGFDWAVATELARQGIDPDAAVSILRFNPHGKNSEARDRYLVRTVERAYAQHHSAR